MGRPRKPSNVLDMNGSARRNPGRMRAQGRDTEPTDIPEIGDPPEWLTGDQSRAWKYIVRKCAAGVLKESDEIAVEIGARLLAKMWSGDIPDQQLRQLDTLLGKLGMNPSDRSKVSAGKTNKKNKFEGVS